MLQEGGGKLLINSTADTVDSSSFIVGSDSYFHEDIKINGGLITTVEVGGDVSSSINVSSDTAFFTCDPQGAGDVCYLPAVASSEGKVIRILNISGSQSISVKTISNANFGGSAGGSFTLGTQLFVTVICDGSSWYRAA